MIVTSGYQNNETIKAGLIHRANINGKWKHEQLCNLFDRLEPVTKDN